MAPIGALLAIPALRLKQKTLGPGYVKSYVKAGMLTHDPTEATAYESDADIFRQISVRMLLDLHDIIRPHLGSDCRKLSAGGRQRDHS